MIPLLLTLQAADLATYALLVAQHVPGRELGPLGVLPLPLVVAAKLGAIGVIFVAALALRHRRGVLALCCALAALGVAANVTALT